MSIDTTIAAAALAIRNCRGVVIAAGAGMGVDSGLPDFRGPEGFWRAYPPYKDQGLEFTDLANPRWFQTDPELAWGFYGHRLDLYRTTMPHEGFARLLELAGGKALAVFTSNVDGQFQRAGFSEEQVVEVHGSIHHLQCARLCHAQIWPAREIHVAVNEETMRAEAPLPSCPQCGDVARPNILMFGDPGFLGTRTNDQIDHYQSTLTSVSWHEWVVVEVGAGTQVPTVRMHSERLQGLGATLIRINPREFFGPPGTLALPLTARDGLRSL